MNEPKKLNKDFWILSSVFSLSAIIGIIANPDRQSPTDKFIVGIIMGIGLACLIMALVILIRNKGKIIN
jgi:peptidoglycan/LPS O-acetylase OafA/YrhL